MLEGDRASVTIGRTVVRARYRPDGSGRRDPPQSEPAEGEPVGSSRALILSAPCFDVVRLSAATSRASPCDDSERAVTRLAHQQLAQTP